MSVQERDQLIKWKRIKKIENYLFTLFFMKLSFIKKREYFNKGLKGWEKKI